MNEFELMCMFIEMILFTEMNFYLYGFEGGGICFLEINIFS